MIERSTARRLVSPAGLLLALLCFGLPFVTVSCESQVTTVSADYTGWDLAFGGRPDVTASAIGYDVASQVERAAAPWQPLAFLAVLVMLGGTVFALARPRWQRLTYVLVGFLGSALLLVNQSVVRGGVLAELGKVTFLPVGMAENMVESRIGYWSALLLMLAVAGWNTAGLLGHGRVRGESWARDPCPAPPRDPPHPSA